MTIEKKFDEIKSIRVFIKNTFKLLTEKHVEIKSQYKTYIDANRKCEYLDSFYFQIKLLDYDYDTTNKLYNYIDNRIYCDYYKLFIIIYSFFNIFFGWTRLSYICIKFIFSKTAGSCLIIDAINTPKLPL